MPTRTAFVAVLLALVVSTGGVVGTVGSTTDGPTGQDGVTAIDECTVITDPGQYVLETDVGPPSGTGPCLQVLADDVTVDGDGFTVDGLVRVGDDTSQEYEGLTLRDVVAEGLVANSLVGLTVTGSDLATGIGAQFFQDVEVLESHLGGQGVRFAEQGTDLVVANNTFDGEQGVSLDERVQRARIVDNVFTVGNGTTSRAVSISSTSGTTSDVLVARNDVRAAGTEGINVVEGSTDVDVVNNTVRGAETGISYLGSVGTVEGNDVRGTDVGISVVAVERVGGDYDVRVLDNRIVDNRIGVATESLIDNRTLRLRGNLISDNTDFGVFNAGDGVVDARGNDWGDPSGPASAPANDADAPFADPVTGTLANGSGDAVSEGDTPGVSNVRFDPFLTDEPPREPETAHYQVDFAVGEPIERFGPPDSDRFYSDQGRLVRFLHGSTEDPVERTGAPATLRPTVAACIDVESFGVEDGAATVRFTVAEDRDCQFSTTLTVYEKPGPGWSRANASEQRLVGLDEVAVTEAGTYELTVAVPTAENASRAESVSER